MTWQNPNTVLVISLLFPFINTIIAFIKSCTNLSETFSDIKKIIKLLITIIQNVPSEIPTKAKFPAKKKSGKKKQQDQDLPNANEDEGSDSELFQPLKKMSNKSNVVKVREEKNRRPENFFYSAFLLQKIFQTGRCTCQRCRIYVGK